MKKYPVEHLVFKLKKPETRDEFINLDKEYWTDYLAQNDGFLSKDVYINQADESEVHTVIVWKTLEQWKSISEADVMEKDKEFTLAYPHSYEITSEHDHPFILVDRYHKKPVQAQYQTGTAFPVEHLVFEVEDVDQLTRFIELDRELWTGYLEKYDGFISKEVWINQHNPNEVQTILYWETLDAWKSIPLEGLIENDKKFTETFGQPFTMKREIHKEYDHKLVRFSNYTKGEL